MQHHDLGRRNLVKTLALGTAAALVTLRMPKALAAAALVPLTSADPTAAALGYVEDSSHVTDAGHTAAMNCSTCAQYLGKAGDARGGCNIYAGKSVNAKGWCKAYAKKPGT
jgi:hypothetical protein